MKLGTDSRGNYKTDVAGQRFYLGTILEEAKIRAIRLRQVWQAMKANGEEWSPLTKQIGLAVARGETEIGVDDSSMDQFSAGFNIMALQEQFPFLRFKPVGEDAPEVEEIVKSEIAGLRRRVNLLEYGQASIGFHAAIDQFISRKVRLDKNPGTDQVSATAMRYERNLKILKEHHSDFPMGEMTLDRIDTILAYWQNRPVVKKTGRPASAHTAREQIKLFRRFLRWACRAEIWVQPNHYSVTPVRIRTLPAEHEARATTEQVKRYKREELAVLWKYAKPLERLFIALALNCGFGAREISTLRRGEIQGDRIGRIRQKSGVYGQWTLWPQTAKALEWYRGQRGDSLAPELMLTKNARPYAQPTAGGNRSMFVANAWSRLLDRIKKDHPEFRRLSFGKLRKTAANLVRRASGSGEIAGTFLCHGRPVKGDDLSEVYSNRLFGPVQRALRRVHRHLAVVFAVVEDAFPKKAGQPALSLGTIERIRQLKKDGFSIAAIARELRLCRDTVRRYATT